jgi:hypothetical protein
VKAIGTYTVPGFHHSGVDAYLSTEKFIENETHTNVKQGEGIVTEHMEATDKTVNLFVGVPDGACFWRLLQY